MRREVRGIKPESIAHPTEPGAYWLKTAQPKFKWSGKLEDPLDQAYSTWDEPVYEVIIAYLEEDGQWSFIGSEEGAMKVTNSQNELLIAFEKIPEPSFK